MLADQPGEMQGASKSGGPGADDQHVRVQPLAFGAHASILQESLVGTVALGMHDFGAVGGKAKTLVFVFSGDHSKNSGEFGESALSSGHQGIAAGKRRYFSYPRPVVLAI